jgi:hypothetical protein
MSNSLDLLSIGGKRSRVHNDCDSDSSSTERNLIFSTTSSHPVITMSERNLERMELNVLPQFISRNNESISSIPEQTENPLRANTLGNAYAPHAAVRREKRNLKSLEKKINDVYLAQQLSNEEILNQIKVLVLNLNFNILNLAITYFFLQYCCAKHKTDGGCIRKEFLWPNSRDLILDSMVNFVRSGRAERGLLIGEEYDNFVQEKFRILSKTTVTQKDGKGK